ncbi:hypothetical protein GCM10010305_37880 [Streptomyces termitum]|uniref:Uncharacterized protein n=2 Tax=Streptomyces termitum TaxID=67368 RepID=A0A918T6E7_9ACTN|nr:hypothetical protein GCM10010305_37880 [Streptomyces termitum]
MARMAERMRRLLPSARRGAGGEAAAAGSGRAGRNLFEAAAVYVAALAEDDQERMEEAATWVSPGQLAFGVNELASRALLVLARERSQTPETVARALLGVRPD